MCIHIIMNSNSFSVQFSRHRGVVTKSAGVHMERGGCIQLIHMLSMFHTYSCLCFIHMLYTTHTHNTFHTHITTTHIRFTYMNNNRNGYMIALVLGASR